ncbi:uncharacterized protein B0T23DRAFT_392265 [Neurospora hispaniola]|uniref:Uncharacterized protein n=1 Tax=Neurospora hispaniola TaxID=588809 RepID=A0AAJ0MVF7_9PEZI|nr:hypothetical protein B0T23DRAFT_392265 [Neurospora hispaniola]
MYSGFEVSTGKGSGGGDCRRKRLEDRLGLFVAAEEVKVRVLVGAEMSTGAGKKDEFPYTTYSTALHYTTIEDWKDYILWSSRRNKRHQERPRGRGTERHRGRQAVHIRTCGLPTEPHGTFLSGSPGTVSARGPCCCTPVAFHLAPRFGVLQCPCVGTNLRLEGVGGASTPSSRSTTSCTATINHFSISNGKAVTNRAPCETYAAFQQAAWGGKQGCTLHLVTPSDLPLHRWPRPPSNCAHYPEQLQEEACTYLSCSRTTSTT